MLSEKDKVIEFVAKLIQLTQDAKINWVVMEPRANLKRHPEFPVDLVYTTIYKEKRLGLYQQRAEYYTFGAMLSRSFGTSGYSGYSPTTRLGTILEMIDDGGNCLWTFQEVSGLNDLYSAVQYQVAGVKGYLDSVLGTDDGKKE